MIENPVKIRTGHEATTKVPIMEQKIALDLQTLLSAVPVKDEEGEHIHIQGVMRNIFREVMQNTERKRKYESFLSAAFKLDKLWRLAGLPNPEHRFRMFVLIYAQQRLFDDIIDGDTPVKLKPEQRVYYGEERIAHLKNGNLDPKDPIDAFAIKILDDIKIIDPRYVEKGKERLLTIMQSILFDGRRILEKEKSGEWKIFSREELERHFFDLDIEGTTGLTLFLFGLADSEKNMKLLKPLGETTRVAYNLQDFSEDIRAGFCNIPKEDTDRLKITQNDLRTTVLADKNFSKFPENINEWLWEQVNRGQKLLKQHNEESTVSLQMLYPPKSVFHKMKNFGYRQIINRKVFNIGYVKEAREVFSSIKKELENKV